MQRWMQDVSNRGTRNEWLAVGAALLCLIAAVLVTALWTTVPTQRSIDRPVVVNTVEMPNNGVMVQWRVLHD